MQATSIPLSVFPAIIGRPTDEELAVLYLTQQASVHKISRMYAIDRRTVRRWLIHAGVPLRTHSEVVNLLVRHPPVEPSILRDLYWNSNLSLKQIGLRLGASSSWVRNQMLDAGVPLKAPWREKYAKTSFSGDSVERAYLTGFRVGDLHCNRDGNQVRIETSTTHPAMWELIFSSFSQYGKVSRTPSRTGKGFQWLVYAYLDRSFEFLLDKHTSIPAEILGDEVLFLAFLSGYLDAEGNLRIFEDDGQSVVSIRINSEDEGILRDIRKILSKMGYHVYFGLEKKEGTYHGKTYRDNVWNVGMFRKDEVVSLLGKLSLRHPEKVEWAHLIPLSLDLKWPSMRPLVAGLRNRIGLAVEGFTKSAEAEYLLRHQANYITTSLSKALQPAL
jgi:hypothetical protein